MRISMSSALVGAVIGAVTVCAAPAQAEVIETSENGFITKDTVTVAATAKETWLALINPADWWSSAHTWSADAANLRLTPQAGGCFCEKIPELVTKDSFTLEGSVEHMRVIQAYPESALRMVGALGPLQSEPVTGVLTIALTEVELPGEPDAFGETAVKATRIVWEYNVGGSMRYEIPVISKAVDGVMSLQLAGLAEKLGPVEMPEEEAPSEEPMANDPSEEEGGDGGDLEAVEDAEVAAIKAEDLLPEGEATEADDIIKGPSVDEAFGDLTEPALEPDPPALR